MSRPYDTTTGSDLFSNILRRLGRLERAGGKMRAPLVEEPITDEVEGAAFYVYEGVLYARIGEQNFTVSLTPL